MTKNIIDYVVILGYIIMFYITWLENKKWWLNMPVYRIKARYNDYAVQSKKWFGWSNCYLTISFGTYTGAKAALEQMIFRDAQSAARQKHMDDFGTKYYYPPFPNEEPI